MEVRCDGEPTDRTQMVLATTLGASLAGAPFPHTAGPKADVSNGVPGPAERAACVAR